VSSHDEFFCLLSGGPIIPGRDRYLSDRAERDYGSKGDHHSITMLNLSQKIARLTFKALIRICLMGVGISLRVYEDTISITNRRA